MGGFVISGVRIQNPESRIQNPESRIQNPESRIQNPESRIQNPESRIQNKIFLPLKWAVYYFVLGWRV